MKAKKPRRMAHEPRMSSFEKGQRRSIEAMEKGEWPLFAVANRHEWNAAYVEEPVPQRVDTPILTRGQHAKLPKDAQDFFTEIRETFGK